MAKIAHIQIAAAPSRAEPDEGELNYGEIFKFIDDVGYSGWVGCEYNRGLTRHGAAMDEEFSI